MESKYTKGQWQLYKSLEGPFLVKSDNGSEWYHDNYSLINEDHKIIGEVQYQTYAGCGWPTVDNHEEFEANAKLIAAAPTMYEYILKKAKEGCGEAQVILDLLKATSI